MCVRPHSFLQKECIKVGASSILSRVVAEVRARASHLCRSPGDRWHYETPATESARSTQGVLSRSLSLSPLIPWLQRALIRAFTSIPSAIEFARSTRGVLSRPFPLSLSRSLADVPSPFFTPGPQKKRLRTPRVCLFPFRSTSCFLRVAARRPTFMTRSRSGRRRLTKQLHYFENFDPRVFDVPASALPIEQSETGPASTASSTLESHLYRER